MKDDSMKNAFIGAIITVALAVGASWMNLNKRIDILEVQVQNDHDMLIRWNEDMKEVKTNVNDIRLRIIQLQDLKEDKDDAFSNIKK
jgi:flagellar biosynthesis chaperone FliJ